MPKHVTIAISPKAKAPTRQAASTQRKQPAQVQQLHEQAEHDDSEPQAPDSPYMEVDVSGSEQGNRRKMNGILTPNAGNSTPT